MQKLLDDQTAAALQPMTDLHARQPIDYAILDTWAGSYATILGKLGVDFCVDIPCPAHMLWMFGRPGTEGWSKPLHLRIERFLLTSLLLGKALDYLRRGGGMQKPWLLNSWPEFEQRPTLPSLCYYTGALLKPTAGIPKLEGEFADFFKKAENDGLPVICVSFGSQAIPDSVIINAIYQGLLGGKWRVIWSMKDWGKSQLIDVDKNQFLIHSWIPQPAVLAHPQCKAFVTHGGWGGLCEAAVAGVPLCVLPFFGDQPSNAEQVAQVGWGLSLPNQKVFPPNKCTVEPPLYTGRLTASEVRSNISKIVEEPSFNSIAKEMQTAATKLGGADAAAKLVSQLADQSKNGLLPKVDVPAETSCFGGFA